MKPIDIWYKALTAKAQYWLLSRMAQYDEPTLIYYVFIHWLNYIWWEYYLLLA
jgi:hypothetical protein